MHICACMPAHLEGSAPLGLNAEVNDRLLARQQRLGKRAELIDVDGPRAERESVRHPRVAMSVCMQRWLGSRAQHLSASCVRKRKIRRSRDTPVAGDSRRNSSSSIVPLPLHSHRPRKLGEQATGPSKWHSE